MVIAGIASALEADLGADPELVGEVLEVTGSLASEGITMLVVIHEMDLAA